MNNSDCCEANEKDPKSDQQAGCGCGSDARVEASGFHLTVGKISGLCKAGEDWSVSAMKENKIPVLSCEGPCAKGEIARRAASLLPRLDPRYKRACHGETFYVPHSSMAKWVREADAVVMIDGCSLSCHGRVLEGILSRKKIIQVNAHAIHKKHANTFSQEEIPEQEIAQLAEQVARKAGSITSPRSSEREP